MVKYSIKLLLVLLLVFTTAASAANVSINAGGSATGSFTVDQYYSGGSTYTNTATINMSQITSNVPPAAIFNSERYGAMSYTIPNLTGAQTVTLYFAETYLTASGQRKFNVSINGSTVLSSFDIYATAGGQNKAIARSFSTTANSNGQVVIQFSSVTENPKVNGITVTGSGGSSSSSSSSSGGGSGPALSVSTTSVNVGSAANSTGTISVTSNVNWSVSSNQSWLSVNPTSGSNDGTVTVTAQQNTATSTRQATVTISATGVTSKTITVTQAAASGGSGKTHAFLLLGQSNMAGFPKAQTADKTQISNVIVLGFDNCSATGSQTNVWRVAVPPLHECSQGAIGPGDWFAKTIISKYPAGDIVALIPCAFSGEKIETMMQGGTHWSTIIQRAQLGQKKGPIEGILFHQGESNNGDSGWPSKVQQFVSQLKSTLGLGNIPFLAGELLYSGSCAGMNTYVNQLPNNISNCYVISASGLVLDPSDTQYKLHFGHDSQVDFGKRYASKMISALGLGKNVEGENQKISPVIPEGYALDQCYPNPFNPTTTITFGIPVNSFVSLKVYNSLGQVITELAGREYSAGRHSVTFNASNLASGAYYYAIKAGDFVMVQKMILQK
jgi:hypothetical protein